MSASILEQAQELANTPGRLSVRAAALRRVLDVMDGKGDPATKWLQITRAVQQIPSEPDRIKVLQAAKDWSS